MIFFGWGRKSLSRQVSPQQALILSYGYFHLFWLFRISYGFRYAVATATEAGWATRPMSAEEAAATGADREIVLSWWWRWGLLVALGVVVVVTVSSIVLSAVFAR